MARRKHLFDEIVDLPWWLGLMLAGVIYVFLRFVVLSIFPLSSSGHGIAQALSNIAWLVALAIAGAALVSAVRQFARGRLLVRQSDLESIRALSWLQFEYLVGEAFRRQGYVVEERGGSGPDGGVDLDLWKSGKKTVVQCKRWKTKQVGVNQVRELFGVMTAEGADEAIVVSSGDYTREAQKFSDGKPIRLIDGKQLFSMIRAVQPEAPITHHLLPITGAPEGTPMCPKCEKPMVRRTAKRGPHAGEEFWGCSGFPECRGTRPAA